MNNEDQIVIAVPKGRILEELLPILRAVGIEPEADFFDDGSRKLQFETNHAHIRLIRVRAFDVATFVQYGAAQLGVVGGDVLAEFDYPDMYAPVDLGIGGCRLSLAEPKTLADNDDPTRWSHIQVATKYPNLTTRHFAARGVQAECIKLNGAMELAPLLGLCDYIVDLVSSGATLKANGLVEVEKILDVSSKLVVNRAASKTRASELNPLIETFSEAVHAG